MTYSLILSTALKALAANKARSILTILGIVIGVAAIVVVVALGQGAQQLIISEIEGIGGNIVVIRPGRQPEGPNDLTNTLFSDSLKERDVRALQKKDNVPGILSVEPAVVVSAGVSYQDEVFRPLILGWTDTGLRDMFHLEVGRGAYFTEDDIRQRSKVVVLGHRVTEELFGEREAIGKHVTIKGHKLRVIGVLDKIGQLTAFNADELVLLPYSTAQKTILGQDFFHEILIRTDDAFDPNWVAEDIRATLRELHGITDPEKDDFFVLTQDEILNNISTVTTILTIFLVSIAAISLVVGGVGIMNIMLVSVTERTAEIGLRKAVGATNKDILRQFLIEAIILTGGGGLLGTILAIIISLIVTVVARQQFNVPWPLGVPLIAVLLGVGTASLTGIVFGLYPARRAARQDPITALRYE